MDSALEFFSGEECGDVTNSYYFRQIVYGRIKFETLCIEHILVDS